MAIETIRLSQQARDQLLRLKRSTGIKNWNVLCRWAFCTSIAETSKPTTTKIPADSEVEMTWKVFGGQHHEVYLALLKARCSQDGLSLSDDVLATQFRVHLHRGIGYLFADRRIRDVGGLFKRLPSMRGSTEERDG
ncbi:MAG: DNA sulfur modification protein DndE [Deltaproteobacteria bacterium]|nr:DNA sulfur modification protein DndE [Deltaproteobacteria bacterium]